MDVDKQQIHIVSDSTCDLSPEQIERHHIRIAPLMIHLGDSEYRDGEQISPTEIFAWSERNHKTPKTSAPSPADVSRLFLELTQDGGEVIAFCISEKMSTMGNVMRIAAEDIGKTASIHVVDSANLSSGTGMLVLEAAEMSEEGYCVDEILSQIVTLKSRVRSSFVVDELKYLYRGGRCNGIEALAGIALKMHPMIRVIDGQMIPGKKYRGPYNRVLKQYVADLTDGLHHARAKRVMITFSSCEPETVEDIRKYLEDLHIFSEICITYAGSIICSHCGPGCLGVLYIERD